MILVLLIIATVLACWSFSLLLRLLSEFIARKRQRLRAEYKREGIIRALIALGLSIFGCWVSARYALVFVRSANTDAIGEGEIVFAISAGLTLFSLMLLIWAIIGERSRGRLRCPKCWYDMDGLVDAPQCPECGKVIKSERHLRKARRMRWPFALAAVCISTGIYGVINIDRVEETDYFALVPSWFLMAGWEHLPEEWISNHNRTAVDACLEDRIDRDWISVRRQSRFGQRLIRTMGRSRETRWDKRRTHLLGEIYNCSQSGFDYNELPHPPKNFDYATLLGQLALDVQNAITIGISDRTDVFITFALSTHRLDPYNMVWAWLVFSHPDYEPMFNGGQGDQSL